MEPQHWESIGKGTGAGSQCVVLCLGGRIAGPFIDYYCAAAPEREGISKISWERRYVYHPNCSQGKGRLPVQTLTCPWCSTKDDRVSEHGQAANFNPIVVSLEAQFSK